MGRQVKSELESSFCRNIADQTASFANQLEYRSDDDNEDVPSMADLAKGPSKTFNAFELTPGMRDGHFK